MLYTLEFGSSGGGGEDPTPNQPPVASFTYLMNVLKVSFNGSGSSEFYGSIVSHAWNFVDGTTGTGVTTSRNYAAAGTYTVTLTVTDDDGATGTSSKSVMVSAPTPIGDKTPVINTIYFTKSSSWPWRKAIIDWSVSDADSDLSAVKLELLSGTTVLESINISVSGGDASGSTELRSRTYPTGVRITVTDGNGNNVLQTHTY